MPIYDYHCTRCENGFEKLQMTSGPPEVVCPKCGSTQVEQTLSAPAIHNTSSGNSVLDREYGAYRQRWKANAYMPPPARKPRT